MGTQCKDILLNDWKTYPNTWDLSGASICKSVHKNLMLSEFTLFNCLQLLYEQFAWFTLTVVRNSKIMTMQHSVTAGMDFPYPSLTYWCFEIGTSAQQHQSESVCTAILKQVTTCSRRNKLKAHHWGMSNAGSDILNCKTIQHFFGVEVSLNNCKSNTKRHGSHASTKHILSWSITPRLLLQTGHKHLSTVIYIFCILKSLSAPRRNQGKVRMKKNLR